MTELRVLCFYLGGREHYRPVIFSPAEVFVSPDCQDGADERGVRTLRSPLGPYDVAEVLARLPAEQRPELVVVKADASLRNLPCSLDRLPCPKILILGDTHHLDEPIRRLIGYAVDERFDRIVTDCNRQHLHYFREAGFDRVHWLPHVAWRPNWREPAAPQDERVSFVGQTGFQHRWRLHVLHRIAAAGLPVVATHTNQDGAADIYARARVTLNCSLNGDLNLRVFEVLSASGLLLTDRLAPEAGLGRLLEEDRHYLGWSDIGELIEKARFHLANPARSEAMRREGRRHIEAMFHPDLQRRRFLELVDGHEDPMFTLDDEPRCQVAVPLAFNRLLDRVAIYEGLQASHRAASVIRLFLPSLAAPTAVDARDLQRWRPHLHHDLARHADEAAAFAEFDTTVPAIEHVLVLDGGDLDALLTAFRGRTVVVEGGCCVLPPAVVGLLTKRLGQWGFARTDANAMMFTRRAPAASLSMLLELGQGERARALLEGLPPVTGSAADCLTLADIALRAGSPALREAFLGKAVRLDRNQRGALIELGRARHAAGDAKTAFLMLNEARRLEAPLDDADEALWTELNAAARASGGPFDDYFAAVEPERRKPRRARRRILLVTNLFPPEEMGGYGRKLWEFSDSLARRGHDLRVLAGSADYLRRPGEESEDRLEPIVSRTLKLYGGWSGGGTGMLVSQDEARAMVRHNTETVFDMVRAFRPEALIVGNIDYIGLDYIQPLLDAGIPVIHSLGTQKPAFSPDQAPRHLLYRPAPASQWVGEEMVAQGHFMERRTVLYPGARTQRFYRLFLPENDRLRILYAGLVLPFKGAHVLTNALALLADGGVDFSCTFAGDTTNQAFLDELRFACAQNRIAEKVSFVGFQDRAGLSRLINSHNVFVFPSIVLEAFGIAQVEAMAAGLACVTTATGGGREIVRDGVDGLLFTPGDRHELADRLRRLLAEPETWRRVQQAGRERALAFSVERSVDVLEQTIEDLLAEAGRRRRR
ncbi:MAG: glycosyltransferase [Alphaproteobacteria bacterium]|nr:glycosyltransferase [Alphaproteobacteria bacterium]